MHGHMQTYPSSSCLLQASINTHAVICVSFKTGDRLVLSSKAWLHPLLSLPPLCTGRWLFFKERPKSHNSRCMSPRYDSKRLCWDGLKLNLIKTTIYTCPFTVSEADTWSLRIRAGSCQDPPVLWAFGELFNYSSFPVQPSPLHILPFFFLPALSYLENVSFFAMANSNPSMI